MVVEPAGAAAVAAVLDQPTAFATPVVAVLSGGNVDPLLLGKLIRHGMASAGRYLHLARAASPTARRPGRGCSPSSPTSQANVLEVAHERTSPTLHIGRGRGALQLETRGEQHAERVLERGCASTATGSSSSAARGSGGSAGVGDGVDDLDLQVLAVGRGVG